MRDFDGFFSHNDYLDYFDGLSFEDVGQVYVAILRFTNYGEEPNFDNKLLNFVFKKIKFDILHSAGKKENYNDKMSELGKKGAEVRWGKKCDTSDESVVKNGGYMAANGGYMAANGENGFKKNKQEENEKESVCDYEINLEHQEPKKNEIPVLHDTHTQDFKNLKNSFSETAMTVNPVVTKPLYIPPETQDARNARNKQIYDLFCAANEAQKRQGLPPIPIGQTVFDFEIKIANAGVAARLADGETAARAVDNLRKWAEIPLERRNNPSFFPNSLKSVFGACFDKLSDADWTESWEMKPEFAAEPPSDDPPWIAERKAQDAERAERSERNTRALFEQQAKWREELEREKRERREEGAPQEQEKNAQSPPQKRKPMTESEMAARRALLHQQGADLMAQGKSAELSAKSQESGSSERGEKDIDTG